MSCSKGEGHRLFAGGHPPPLPRTNKAISVSNINRRVINSEYAVRGEIVQLAQRVAKDLAERAERRLGNNGVSSSTEVVDYPFERVVWCNIGNPQILGQKPITYFRQVLALCEFPQLLQHPQIADLFPSDVISRAKLLLHAIPGGVGAYSESAGAAVVRELVSGAISRRDGHPSDPDNIFMTDGASPAVHYMMDLLLRDDTDGLMVPIPQYPLYSATLTLYGGQLVPYTLDESKGWGLDVEQLKSQLADAKLRGLCVRGMVVINPGNPTGQCLPRENMEEVLKFCAAEKLVLIADEVYQANIYVKEREFFSFKKIACELGILADVPLVSLHSISKGFIGECGRRGGYMETTGFPHAVKEQIMKLASINLCPNLSGQICCALMMNPPAPGEPSYETYMQEKTGTLGSLKRRAELLGALYAFPRVRIPLAACAEATRLGKQPDWLYCKELLQATGIVVVPGSGFGQADGTYHFRTTFLPSEEDIGMVVQSLSTFHAKFLTKYGGLTAAEMAGEDEVVEVVAENGGNGAGKVPALVA
ncbi:MAG: hypothetical protein WDW38_010678 [Sanguina aurantia]